MSYEGWKQNICERGHRFDGEGSCDLCGAPACWTNPVDSTNGYEEGFIQEEDWESLREGTDGGGFPVYLVPCEGGPPDPVRSYWDGHRYRHLRES